MLPPYLHRPALPHRATLLSEPKSHPPLNHKPARMQLSPPTHGDTHVTGALPCLHSCRDVMPPPVLMQRCNASSPALMAVTHRESHALLDHLGLGGVHEGRMGAVGLSSSSSSLGWRR